MPHKEPPRTRRALLRAAAQELAAAGGEVPGRQATWLLAEAAGCAASELHAHPEQPVAPDAADRFEEMLRRRLGGEPLQYVIGHTDFYGLRVEVTPAVLIPRPETEGVVEEALRLIEPVEAPRVLDVGTGSGCIALAINHVMPDAHVYACDTSREALTVAQRNAQRLALDVRFTRVDALAGDARQCLPGGLDLLISNPPYIPDAEADALPAEVRGHEPAAALFSGADPLRFYRALAVLAGSLLAPGGALVLEAHADYAHGVGRVLQEAGLGEVRVECDLAGRPRVAVGRRGA